MGMTFRHRLLRLFLLFSLAPATIMALVALWLAAGSFGLREDNVGSIDRAFMTLLEYQQADAEQRLTRAISPDRHLSTGDMGPVDAIFSVDGDSLTIISAAAYPVPALLREIDVTTLGPSTHWRVTSSGPAQIVCRQDSLLDLLCAAKIHPRSYQQAIQLFEQSHRRARESTERGGYYFAFVAILLGLVLLAAAIVATVFSRRTSARLADPIAATTEVVNDIARGDFARRVHADASGEVAVLVESVNRMAQQLDDLTRRLSQSERVAAWRGIAKRFAHELRNPLQPVAVSLYQIRKAVQEGADPGRINELVSAIDEEISHLTHLAERFSALSRMPDPEPRREDLSELLRSIAHLYRERMTGHDFGLSVPNEPVYAQVDVSYLREAIHNLLKNAREATPEGRGIELSLTVNSLGQAIIEVKDQGQGMNAGQMASARLPYFTTRERGSGLGLALVERVAADCGGRLDIESEPRVGTTVRLVIPLAEEYGE